MLTARQLEVYRFVRGYHRVHKEMPTLQTIADNCQPPCASRSNAYDLMNQLCDRGYIWRNGRGRYRLPPTYSKFNTKTKELEPMPLA